MPNENVRETYDHIVVGAGSAGCVVATRLSENPEVQVLLLEAGGPATHPDVQDPAKWPTLFYGELDWGYSTTPQRHLNGRTIHCPRGKMLGGCHSHNASAWVRGHPSDFDGWAALGNPGWDAANAQRLYQKLENWTGPPSDLRGKGGPIHVEPAADPNPIARAFVESGSAVGLPTIDDLNGPSMEGIGFFNMTVKDGKRYSVVDAMLLPALERPNLTVVMRAETRRLLLEGTRCRGVEVQLGDALVKTYADKEVIVCAGAIGSPVLLLRSGIGPTADLAAVEISTTVDLQGVGKNLQDHPLVYGINYECIGDLPAPRNNGAESTFWWKSRPNLASPDIQPVIIEFPLVTPELLERYEVPPNSYAIATSVVRPASRGTVKLASKDPADDPLIDFDYLSADADLEAMLVAIDMCREMGESDAFKDLRKREIMPGNLDRAEMIEFVRLGTSTYFHPTSSCKMGVDDEAVVDPELRVHGVEGLRVADASIMPFVTTGNTNAPSIMIGEKAAEMIAGS